MSTTSSDDKAKGPQDELNEFWENLITKNPTKVTSIFPRSLYANLLPPSKAPGPAKGKNAAESYEAAAEECRARVKRIVRECQRTNEKFTDPEFDIENDEGTYNCLEGLMYWYNGSSGTGAAVSSSRLGEALNTLVESNVVGSAMTIDISAAAKILQDTESGGGTRPGSVHRVDWIFDEPSFTVDGYSSSDVKQGANGDCWFIAAVATICSSPSLMDKVCVAKDAECGVYGFVFYRDGEWVWTVIDDNLYLRDYDFDAYGDDYDPTSVKEAKYKKNYQTGSDALYFASCADQNEIWLPLLEKAYAKIHGDYDSIAGGWSGEAVEDLTGGVTTKVLTNRILSKERLWKELLEVNKTFLFSASSPGSYGSDSSARQGLALNHAYSVIKAVEEEDKDGKKHRLVLIRNPWGRRAHAGMGEWTGPWSDGSKEWTPYWMEKLNHTFGDDGLFWMSYADLCKRFELLDRTRLFDKEWTVVQNWTSVSVAWVTGFLNTKFVVEIKKGGPTIFVLCQLDERYFCGLEGKYSFDLHFLLQETNAKPGDHIVRARGAWFGNRSISAEVDLEPGIYEVVPKIVASRNPDAPEVLDVVKQLADKNPQKLRQIGMNYDIANAKGIIELTPEEKKKKEEKKKAAEEKKKKEKEDAEKEKAEFEAWKKEKKEREEKEKAEKEKAEKEKVETAKSDDKKEEVKGGEATAVKEGDVKEEPKTEDAAGSKPTEEKNDTTASDSTPETVKEEPAAAEKIDKPAEDNAEEKRETDPKPEDKPEPPAPKAPEEATPPTPDPKDADSSSSSAQDTPPSNDSPEPKGAAPAPNSLALRPAPPRSAYAPSMISGPPSPNLGPLRDGYYADAVAAAPAAAATTDSKQNPWAAVCVLGLRVYSKDTEVSIKLVNPKDPEEGAVLDADGATPAGATM